VYEIEPFVALNPPDGKRVIISSDDQIVNGIHVILLLLQIERPSCGSPHQRHVMANLVAPHLVNGANGREHVEIAGREFGQLVWRKESEVCSGQLAFDFFELFKAAKQKSTMVRKKSGEIPLREVQRGRNIKYKIATCCRFQQQVSEPAIAGAELRGTKRRMTVELNRRQDGIPLAGRIDQVLRNQPAIA